MPVQAKKLQPQLNRFHNQIFLFSLIHSAIHRRMGGFSSNNLMFSSILSIQTVLLIAYSAIFWVQTHRSSKTSLGQESSMRIPLDSFVCFQCLQNQLQKFDIFACNLLV